MKKHVKRSSTPWRPALWERTYRGVTIWVEEVYARAPKWEWTAGAVLDPLEDSGRAHSKAGAMRDVQRAIDNELGPITARGSR